MKKTMNDIFDEAKANELEALLQKNAAPDVSDKTLSSVKKKTYAKTGLSENEKKKTILVYFPAIAVVACLCLTMVVIWFGTGIFDFDSAVSNVGEEQDIDKDWYVGDNSNGGPSNGGSSNGGSSNEVEDGSLTDGSSNVGDSEGSSDDLPNDEGSMPVDDTAPVIEVKMAYVELIIGDPFNIMDCIEVSNYTSISFESSQPEYVSVDSEGNVTAHISEGGANILVVAVNGNSGRVSEAAIFCIGYPQSIPNILLHQSSARLEIGQIYDLNKMIFTAAENVYFESEDPTVATVSDEGMITGMNAGITTIRLYVEAKGERILSNTFEVLVKAPWTPGNSIEEEIVSAKEKLTEFENFTWYKTNVSTSHPQYNLRGQENTSPGITEIWEDTLHLYLRFRRDEVDATIGWKEQSTYNFYFDFYYCPYDSYNKIGTYKKATLQAWSVYDEPRDPIYRCKFYDAFEMKTDPLVEGQLYDVVIVVREGDRQLGYAKSEFVWTDSCAIYTEYAESHPEIFK
ncbi:MAG: hypothetical protein E7599_04990 [Ruminococcaceae bacterium]|nr:hypothetical protein [Oscillospiraceae bacterium]